MSNNISQVTLEMKEVAKKAVAEAHDYEQVVVVKTEKEVLCFVNNGVREGDYAIENAFIAENSVMLQEIKYILCMWEDGTMDIPSKNFRDGIVALSEVNKNTEVLINTGNEILTKSLSIMK